MKGWLRRAVCAAAGALAFAGAAQASALAPFPFDPNLPATTEAVDLSQASVLPDLAYGPPPARLGPADGASTIALVSGLDLTVGSKLDLTSHTTLLDAADDHVFGDLFLSSAASGTPYDALAAGGNVVGADAALGDNLHVGFGIANLAPGASDYMPGAGFALGRFADEPTPYAQRGAKSLLAGVSWDIGHWGELNLTASQTSERDGLLGIAAPGLTANTAALGVSAKVHLGNGWVTSASYGEGVSQIDLKPGLTPSLAFDSLHTRSYGIAIAKNGLFGDDALGVAVSRPAFDTDGSQFITLSGGAGWSTALAHSRQLQASAPETDVEIGYVTTFMDGAVALQTNAAFQMNYNGQGGTNAVSLLSRARIKF